MIQAGPDILSILRDHGFSPALNVLFAGVIVVLLYLLAKARFGKQLTLHDTIDDRLDSIEITGKAILDLLRRVTDNPIRPGDVIRRHDVMELLNLIRSEVASKCGSANCPLVPAVKAEMSAIHKDVTASEEASEKFWMEIRDYVREIFQDNKAWHDTVGRELLLALVNRDQLIESKKKGTPDAKTRV